MSGLLSRCPPGPLMRGGPAGAVVCWGPGAGPTRPAASRRWARSAVLAGERGAGLRLASSAARRWCSRRWVSLCMARSFRWGRSSAGRGERGKECRWTRTWAVSSASSGATSRYVSTTACSLSLSSCSWAAVRFRVKSLRSPLVDQGSGQSCLVPSQVDELLGVDVGDLVQEQVGRAPHLGSVLVCRSSANGGAVVHGLPPALAALAASRVVLDEAVRGELAQVIAGRAARLAEPFAELGGGGGAVVAQRLQDPDAQGVGEAAQGAGVEDALSGRVWRCLPGERLVVGLLALGHGPKVAMQRRVLQRFLCINFFACARREPAPRSPLRSPVVDDPRPPRRSSPS